jgi:hypothetical protein
VDTGQLVPTLMPRGQPLTWMVTIGDTMPLCVLFSRDTKFILMSLRFFLTLQIPMLSSTLAPPVRGPSGDVMETNGSVVVPVAGS